MKISEIKKVMILDEAAGTQAHAGFYQMLNKAKQLFNGLDVEFTCVAPCKTQPDIQEGDHNAIAASLEDAVIKEKPELLLIPATPVGEEIAPTLGIKFDTGVAAHCLDIKTNEQDRITYMVPAFGGKVIGEIFVPATAGKCAIATSKPGTFDGDEASAGAFRIVESRSSASQNFKLIGREKMVSTSKDITKADVVVCGGFGIENADNWRKIVQLAELLGGAAGSTRPVIDAGWGPSEDTMIGTSGKSIKPKVYVGFGVSGAAHHLCGIQKAGVIINVNNDEKAESLKASDYIVTEDAGELIEALLKAAQS